VEAIVKVVVNEVIVIMAMPIVTMPSTTVTIPPGTAMPRAACKARAAHWATKTSTTGGKMGPTEVSATHPACEVTSATEASTTETVGSVRLLHDGRGEN